MKLSDRALQALIDIRKDLLSRDAVLCTTMQEDPPVPIEEKPRPRTFRGHHPKQTTAFQRGCQNRAFWSPVH